MDWSLIINDLVKTVLIPLICLFIRYLPTLISLLTSYVKNKVNNDNADKYIDRIAKIIEDAVITTNQTYVDNLKKQDSFTVENQKEAFKMSFDAVMAQLTDDTKEFIIEAYGDLTVYITNKIEAEVNKEK